MVITNRIERLIVSEAPRRSPSRKMSPEEKADWEAVDRWAREVRASFMAVQNWILEVQKNLEGQ